MLYFDTSILAPLILQEAASEKIEDFFARLPAGQLYVSHWTRVEFASLIAREVRMGGLVERDALLAIGQFDELVAESFQLLAPGVMDYEQAKRYIQHFATRLRAGHSPQQRREDTLHPGRGVLNAAKLMKVHASRGIKTWTQPTTVMKQKLKTTTLEDGQDRLTRFGFRMGRSGAHASRTMMLSELDTLLDAAPAP